MGLNFMDPDGVVHEDASGSARPYSAKITLCERWEGEAYASNQLTEIDAPTTCVWCLAAPDSIRRQAMPPPAPWRPLEERPR